MKKILTAIIILASLFITNCDNIEIALGSALNLKGPVVEIAGPISVPGSDPPVGTLFNLYGTATSNSTVARMTVTLTYFNRSVIPNRMVQMGREWKWEGGSWQTREGSNQPWKTYNKSVYADDYEEWKDQIDDPSWDLTDGIVTWNLPVYMIRMEKGQYFITVTAWDNTGNSDSNSSKRLKVEFSNQAPTLKVDTPTGNIATQLMESGEGSSLDAPKPPDYSGTAYKFDPFGDPQQTYENRFNFVNKFPDFRWTAEQQVPLTRLLLEITNEHNLDTMTEKKNYYSREFTGTSINFAGTSKTSRGSHTDSIPVGSPNGSYTVVGPAIVFNPEFSANYNDLPKDKITPMQVVTTLVDTVGGKEYKSKGWFLWLPDSDKPYADITFGYKVKTGETPPADACDRAIILRGSRTNRITFFDDKEGLLKASIWVTKLRGNTFDTDTSWPAVEVNFTNQQTNPNYNFIAELGYGAGRYKIEVQATDYGKDGINGTTTGDVYTAYFTIVANTSPEILAWDTAFADRDSEILSTTLWGDTKGDINFWGRAAIEGSAGESGIRVDRVTIVLLNYENGDQAGSQNELRYIDPTYSDWSRGTKEGYTDRYGNKVWEIPFDDIDLVSPGIQGSNLGDNNRDEWRFKKTFNWFTDLNGFTSTKNKKLLVRALTKGALDREYYGTKAITIHGDDSLPKVTVKQLYIENYQGGAWVAQNPYPYNLPYTEGIIPAITPNHRIKLAGEWNDDSALKWTNIADKTINDLFKVSIRWDGNQGKYALVQNTANTAFTRPSSETSNGKWETNWFQGWPSTGNADPLITLSAAFTDLGGNFGEGSQVVTVETDTPTLSRISSEAPNGRYGPNKNEGKIDIFLGFNKPIYTTEQPTNAGSPTCNLYLTLNNGGRAYYKSGLGDIASNGALTTPGQDKIVFTYNLADSVTDIGETRLNVTGIVYKGSTWSNGDKIWKSSNNSDAIIQNSNLNLFPATNSSSLAGQKNIIIDKNSPLITSVTTTAQGGNTYGKDQQLVFIVEFNEDIDTGASISATTTSLTLSGSSGFTKTATYYGRGGSRSVQFLYTVGSTDNSANDIYVSGYSGFNYIMDKAMNPVTPTSASVTGLNYPLGKSIKIDTTAPTAPSITVPGLTSGGTTYGDVTVTVGNIETGARWEYNTNYTPGITTGWIAKPAGSSNTITFTANGTYTIVARQYDGALPANASPESTPFTFTINSGAILTKITSNSNSGSYGYGVSGKDTISIVLEFRIPVKFSGVNATNAFITLNTTGTGENRVFIPTAGATTAKTKWVLSYSIPAGISTPSGTPLNVSSLNFRDASGVTITDDAGKDIKTWVDIGGAWGVTADNMLNKQKEIYIYSGRPVVTPNYTLGTAQSEATGMWFNGNQLGIKFDREISRNSAVTGKLVIRQISDDYRIPAVLTEQRFTDLFSGREDMFTDNNDISGLSGILSGANNTARAQAWERLGAWLYEKGSNGATCPDTTGTGVFSPDTTTKYVLRFSIDTAAAAATSFSVDSSVGVTGNSITLAQLANLFRAAESQTFGVNDPKITISNNVLTVDLTDTRALPVRGASYEWLFPNGFVIDSLGRPSGTQDLNVTPSGNDTNISSSGTTRRLNYMNGNQNTGRTNITVESPVIRIDKGDDNTYFAMDSSGTLSNTTNYNTDRQARQKLVTQVKIDCRTPGAAITYASRSQSDNVRTLMYRNGGAIPGTDNINLLPNLGTMAQSAAGRTSWENLRMRPQSGVNGVGNNSPITNVNWTNLGLNYYTAVTSATWSGNSTYSPATTVTIGTVNYNDGGQEINLRASATATNMTNSSLSFEAAYRSVLVFCNAYINTGKNGWDNGLAVGGDTIRVWVRGSNTAQGDPTIPDFPIARDASLYKKVKLMTPITPPAANTYATTTVLNDSNVAAADANGRNLWFWVTWRINVPAFIDLQVAALSTSGTHAPAGNTIRKYYMTYIPSVEHYAVHPGRTTIMEARDSYNNQWDGSHGSLALTTAFSPPTQKD